ncbi:hypothetical protein CMI47_07065 [Candidatus Pacearchaeota archaeon]|jgi:hypothetical protein|nr:hypothetical protein [Candidatus Pacearchaeota archaeon]|tara:strand:- start:5609 stop:6088 length:480 start_codon:yes stop_codon:yes gene_type:complete
MANNIIISSSFETVMDVTQTLGGKAYNFKARDQIIGASSGKFTNTYNAAKTKKIVMVLNDTTKDEWEEAGVGGGQSTVTTGGGYTGATVNMFYLSFDSEVGSGKTVTVYTDDVTNGILTVGQSIIIPLVIDSDEIYIKGSEAYTADVSEIHITMIATAN